MVKKRCVYALTLICGIFLIWSIVKIINVNSDYPQTEEIYVESGDTYKTKENIVLSIKRMNWIKQKKLQEKYGEYDGTYGVLVTISLENVGEKKENFYTYDLYLENEEYYCNGVSMEMYLVENKTDNMKVKLKPGEKKEVTVTYNIAKTVCFSEEAWNRIQDVQYYLVYKRYPQKIYWKC